MPQTDGESEPKADGGETGSRPPRPRPNRRAQIASAREGRQIRIVRWAVGVTAAIAVVVLVSLAFSGDRRPAPEGTGGGTAPTSGIASRLLRPEEIAPGFVEVTAERQTLTDLVAGAADKSAERDRLTALGMQEAAIAVDVKAPDRGGPLAGGSVTTQIVRFASPESARSQVAHDRQGALASDFGIRNVESTGDAGAGDSGFTLRGTGAPGPNGAAGVSAIDVAAGQWQIVLVVETPPGAARPADGELVALAQKQIARLG